MAPPKPPFPAHQTTFNPAPKRRHHTRHAQQHQKQPEEPHTPAARGREDGSSPPPVRSHTAALHSGKGPIPAAPGSISTPRENVDGESIPSEQQASLRSGRRPPLLAEKAVPGKSLLAAGLVNSGDLGSSGTRDLVEGTTGYLEQLSGSAISALPDNGDGRNTATFQPDSAPHVFDNLPERATQRISRGDVQTVDGEAWERGPETILHDGSTIRAIFVSPTHGLSQILSDAGDSGMVSPLISNVRTSTRPGRTRAPPTGSSKDGQGGGGHATGRTWEAEDRNAANLQAVQAGCYQDSGELQGVAPTPSDGPGGSKQAFWKVNNTVYAPGREGGEGRTGGINPEGVKLDQIWTDCSNSVSVSQDSGQIANATDFDSFDQRPRSKGELVVGHMSYGSGSGGAERRTGGALIGGAKTAQIWADCSLSEPDLAQVDTATDFDLNGQQPRELGGTKEGLESYQIGGERGAQQQGLHYAGRGNIATQQRSQTGSGEAADPDFGSFEVATVSEPEGQRPRGQGRVEAGQVGFGSSLVRGATGSRQHYATPSNTATQQQSTAGAAPNLSNTHTNAQVPSAWGRPPHPPRVGGWSPGYREAFPTIRGDVGAVEAALTEFQEEMIQLASQLNGDHVLNTYPDIGKSMNVRQANRYAEDAVARFLEAGRAALRAGANESAIITMRPALTSRSIAPLLESS